MTLVAENADVILVDIRITEPEMSLAQPLSKIVFVIAVLTLVSMTARAHHSASIYDMGETLTVDGVITEIDWANPHVYLHVAEKTESGDDVLWEVETLPPAAMRRIGWTSETLKTGDSVVVIGNPARGEENRGLFPVTIAANGLTLFEQNATIQQLSTASADPGIGATDLSGTWETLAELNLYLGFYNPSFELTEAGTSAFESYDELTMLPALDCIPYPAPLLMIDPDFKQIVIGEDEITIRGGYAEADRTIHMNIATHDGATPTLQGHSLGRWEGETLVIDTSHFAEHRIGNGYRGVASGSQKRLAERLTLEDGGKRLRYQFELTDGEFLAEPVTGEVEWVYRADLEYVREDCQLENARRFLTKWRETVLGI